MGCAVAVIGLSVAEWLAGRFESAGDQPGLAGRAAARGGARAGGAALAVRPSGGARGGRRLALDERLGTAVELANALRRHGHGRRFDRLQIRDAIAQASVAPGGWLALDRRIRRDAVAVSALIVLAAASLPLPNLPRPSLARDDPAASMADAAGWTWQLEARALPSDAPVPAAADPQLAQQQTRTSADLAARVQQEQAERDALDTLSQALGRVSAAQTGRRRHPAGRLFRRPSSSFEPGRRGRPAVGRGQATTRPGAAAGGQRHRGDRPPAGRPRAAGGQALSRSNVRRSAPGAAQPRRPG